MKIDELVEGVEYSYECDMFKLENGELLVLGHQSGKWASVISTYKYFTDIEFAECEFKPEDGEVYYYPSFRFVQGYDCSKWDDDETDKHTKSNVGIYRTREQALKKSKELGWVE